MTDYGDEEATQAFLWLTIQPAAWAQTKVGSSFIPPGEPGATATSSRSTPASAMNASISMGAGRSV